jgi:hypothetical protein
VLSLLRNGIAPFEFIKAHIAEVEKRLLPAAGLDSRAIIENPTEPATRLKASNVAKANSTSV